MKKIIKTFLTTLLIIVLFSNNTTVYAEASEASNVTPRWSNANSISTNFVASSSGGKVSINYIGYSDSFSRAEVNVKLQKRFLLLFWSDVDEWNTNSTEYSDILTHTFSLNGTGTYKAIFTVKIIGIDGTVDTYTNEIESKY